MSKPSVGKISLRLLTVILIMGLVVAAAAGIAFTRLRTPLPLLKPETVHATMLSTAQPINLAWPSYGQAALGLSGHGVLAAYGDQTPTPTASIAKLITALTVLQVKPLVAGSQGPLLTLDQRDIDYYNLYASEDGSVALVASGEHISEYQVLEGMLLPSANNLADTLATWAFGSLSSYAEQANQMLAKLGLTHTHVGADASGYQPSTTSTASDLVRLGEIVNGNPVLAGIVSQSTATIPVAGTVSNVNWLLGTAGINGLKTGNNNQVGGNFLFSAAYQVPGGPKVTTIGAIVGAPTLGRAMDSALPLLVSSQRALGYSPVLAGGQAVGQYGVPWADKVTAVTSRPIRGLTWQGVSLDIPRLALSDLRAPQTANATVGAVSFATNVPPPASSTPVKLTQAIPQPSWWWRIVHL